MNGKFNEKHLRRTESFLRWRHSFLSLGRDSIQFYKRVSKNLSTDFITANLFFYLKKKKKKDTSKRTYSLLYNQNEIFHSVNFTNEVFWLQLSRSWVKIVYLHCHSNVLLWMRQKFVDYLCKFFIFARFFHISVSFLLSPLSLKLLLLPSSMLC